MSPAFVQSGPVLCLHRRLTGLMCPGCGLSRSFVFISHGDFAAAFRFHLFGPLVYLIFVLTLLWVLVPRSLHPSPEHRLLTWLWRVGSIAVVSMWLLWWAVFRLFGYVL